MSDYTVLVYHELIPAGQPVPTPGPVRTAQGMDTVLPPALYVREEDFAAQLDWLAASGRPVLPPRALVDGSPIPPGSVVISFDDFWKTGITRAAPYLRRHGFTALGFLVRSWLFDEPQTEVPGRPVCLSWGELDDVRDVFVTANHGDRLHVLTGGKPALLTADADAVRDDARRCAEVVDLPQVYAYPFGASSPAARVGLAAAGVTLALGTEPGTNGPGTDPLALRRTIVPGGVDLPGFIQLLSK